MCNIALVEELDTPSEGAFANCDKMNAWSSLAGLGARAALHYTDTGTAYGQAWCNFVGTEK